MLKVAILSNVTTGVLANMLSGSCEVWNDVAFDGWYQSSLDPPQTLKDFNPDKILILIDERFAHCAGDVSKAKASLTRFFPAASVLAPDIKSIARDYGELFYDERMWMLAKIPWSHLAHVEFCKMLSPKKVAAVDFDYTLYSGALNECPLEEIVPDDAFLEELKALKDRGVLLLGLTKNDPSDIERLFEKEDFALSKDDFAEICANWNDKADNLKAFSQKSKLSLDSFVFFDDNSSERARMRKSCPEVTVASYPFKASDYFFFGKATKEDSQKTEMYMQEKERGILSGRVSLEEYFSELKIRLSMGKLDGENLERVFQLSQKTNRFNVTTNRYSREELDSFLDDPNRRFFVFSAEDSFGDYGVIGFVNVQIEDDTGFIADWVMSCRAMSRTIEYAAQEFVERELAESGVSVLNALFIDSGNNAPVRNLFDDFGFELLESGETGKKYTLALPRQKPMKKHYVSICR